MNRAFVPMPSMLPLCAGAPAKVFTSLVAIETWRMLNPSITYRLLLSDHTPEGYEKRASVPRASRVPVPPSGPLKVLTAAAPGGFVSGLGRISKGHVLL